MKKRDKFKNFIKKTLFGEKLENALQEKNEIKKPLPIVEPKTHFPAVSKTVRNDNPPLEKPPEVLSELPDKAELNQINPTFEIRPNAESIAAFRKIMQTRFDENAKATIPLVRLGIDLGTSYSKVVWRKGEDNVFPICFGKNKFDLADYLMPSLVAFDGEKIATGFEAFSFPQSAISNFKMCLACESKRDGECNIRKCSLTIWKREFFPVELTGGETRFVNSLFLAKLLARTKESIVDELTKNHGFSVSVKPKWTANYTVPDTFIEQSDIAESFREVFRIAWFMAEIFVKEPNIDNRQTLVECYLAAQDLAKEFSEIFDDETLGCSPYPEIGAEVASIVMSRTSETGLYAFVDVGAGTIDASVFRYFRDGNKAERVLYANDISRTLGAAQLEIRASRISLSSPNKLKEIKENYQSFSKLDREKNATEIESLKSASEEIKEEAFNTLKKVFIEAYREKEPNIEKWKDLKLILGGGGSKIECYEDAALKAFTIQDYIYKDFPQIAREPKITDLPKPDDFQMLGLPETGFHRFAVAYGLTYDISQLPKVIFAKDVRSIIQPKSKRKLDSDADR